MCDKKDILQIEVIRVINKILKLNIFLKIK